MAKPGAVKIDLQVEQLEAVLAKAIVACLVKAAKRIASLSDNDLDKLRLVASRYEASAPKERMKLIDWAVEILIPEEISQPTVSGPTVSGPPGFEVVTP